MWQRLIGRRLSLRLARTCRAHRGVPLTYRESGTCGRSRPCNEPTDLTGKSVLTDEEAAKYAKLAQLRRERRRNRAIEHRDGLSEVDRVPYDDFWVDAGTTAGSDRRTSLIVEPPDGRIPALTADAEQRARRVRETWQRPVGPVRERVRGRSPARRHAGPRISDCRNAASLVSARGRRSSLVGTTTTRSCSRLRTTW